MKKVIVSPSVLNADFLHFADEVERIKEAGIKWIHFDVMDGEFVKNVSFGNLFLKDVCPKIDLIKDVHIMINKPLEKVDLYTKCQIDYLTFHYEACESDAEVFQVIDRIHEKGVKAGISIKPNTPVEKIFPFLHSLDVVLIMCVEPGLGGQRFMDLSLNKIRALKNRILEERVPTLISVDGGVNDKTAPDCLNCGADILVVGQYLFGHADFKERYERLIK
ncbi:MAG: ribulose-phosphate 3-epimerase [Bacilli bacterium]|nr:ribulose-phosphate 3-epimerase [Bacilli bacterium]